MAHSVNSAYAGEALEQMLVRATTGNELVERKLIHIEPDIATDFYLPRFRLGKVLQKRKEQPSSDNSKGDITYDERKLTPREVMAYAEFNPRMFEKLWRPLQPKGNLVFAELPDNVKATLLSELAKTVNFELGAHLINGVYAEGADDAKLFDGIVTRIAADAQTIKIAAPVAITESNVIEVLGKVYKAIPKAIRGNKNLRILMSIEDFDKYDAALSNLPNKGTAYTDSNVKRFKGITIEALADMKENVIVATIVGNDLNSNLWMGVSSLTDINTVEIAKVTNNGEKYFFKMLMKVDTQIAWGDYCVLYDGNGNPV